MAPARIYYITLDTDNEKAQNKEGSRQNARIAPRASYSSNATFADLLKEPLVHAPITHYSPVGKGVEVHRA